MAKVTRLSSRQFALIDDLFEDKLNEREAPEKHKVSRQLYHRWSADGQFAEQVNQRIVGGHRERVFLIARHARSAAVSLVKLAECGKGETARKASLDVMTINKSTASAGTLAAPDAKTEEPASISPQTASRLLAILAEEDNDR